MSRIANFSSSSIYKLMSNGKGANGVGAPFTTYVKEKIREHRVGRSISNDASAKSLNWGNFTEGYVFNEKIDMKYKLVSKERFYHETLAWSGMPDLLADGVVGDIKNPFTINSFCDAVDSFDSLESFKKSKPEYYWQLVSNAILCNCKEAVSIVYIPYKNELDSIREYANNYDGDQNKIAFINWAEDSELPYIEKGKYYSDVNKFHFEVPEEDKEALIARVTMADKILKEATNG